MCCGHTGLMPFAGLRAEASPHLTAFLSLAFVPAAADDDMETMAQRYLSAAIKLGRPPNHCVVFASCPTSVTGGARLPLPAVLRMRCALAVAHSSSQHLLSKHVARSHDAHTENPPSTPALLPSLPPPAVAAAHNCTMRAVAMLGTHKAFNLKNADLTCASMSELTVYNIRCVGWVGGWVGGWAGGRVGGWRC